ncbi:MAG: NUDIX hydrolase [Candidatus Kaiserbacteria bacterium]|nr:NUDIX hydrolase [Candidatus Kaiserbacteria bacterium]
MPKKFTDEEYAKLLPKKQVGTAVLFFNSQGELLIVKPDYKEGWLVPGGSCDDNESPLHCALRETKEEIGLTVATLNLAGIYYAPKKEPFTDSLKFIFDGGVLTDEQISQIKLQTEELLEYTFALPEKAIPMLSPRLRRSVPDCLRAIKERKVVYLDNTNY